jgi:hypothetical protein
VYRVTLRAHPQAARSFTGLPSAVGPGRHGVGTQGLRRWAGVASLVEAQEHTERAELTRETRRARNRRVLGSR